MRKNMKKKEDIVKRLMTIGVERQLRCGDGSGVKTFTHNTNCDCPRLILEARSLESELEENK